MVIKNPEVIIKNPVNFGGGWQATRKARAANNRGGRGETGCGYGKPDSKKKLDAGGVIRARGFDLRGFSFFKIMGEHTDFINTADRKLVKSATLATATPNARVFLCRWRPWTARRKHSFQIPIA